MAKLKKSEIEGQFEFICPGCKLKHVFSDQWEFNGNIDNPTISPSLHVRCGRYEPDKTYTHILCHSYIKNGQIRFLNDSTHSLAGKTVELKEI